MTNKNKIGVLVIFGGIALLGYVYFKKTKPTIAQTQLDELNKQSDYYKGDGVKADTKINVDYTVQPITNKFGNDFFLGDAFSKELREADNYIRENMALYGTPNDPNKIIDESKLLFPNFVLTQEVFDGIKNGTDNGGIDMVALSKLIKK